MTIQRLVLLAAALATAASCNGGGTDPGNSQTIQVLITPSSPAILPGGTVTLHATVTGPPGITQGVVWTSLTDSIATITTGGVVTGLAEGSAVIKAAWAEDPEEFNTISVLVTSTPVEGAAVRTPIRRVSR
jgi:uncharacterized protein YjdB